MAAMKQMSFALTTAQFRARTKDVTRRLGWEHAKAGDRVMAIEKGQGLKKGEHPVKLGEIVFKVVRREPLDDMRKLPAYGAREVAREGFPDLTAREFVRMFCKHNCCKPRRKVTRIEFEYV
jgi:hypothetical protein